MLGVDRLDDGPAFLVAQYDRGSVADPATVKKHRDGARLLAAWRRLSPLPGGRFVFTMLVRWMIPYTGSTWPRVEQLEPGHARISIKQRRRLEQHLGSIHAIALANVAEFASGAVPGEASRATILRAR